MSRFSMISDEFSTAFSEERLEAAKNNLKDFLARSIILQVNKLYGIIDNIILVADGGSWRNRIDKPSTIVEEYKGNRSRSEDVEWAYVFESLSEIQENLRSLGVTACKNLGVEGDDWIWHWSTKLNKEGINCIIWSSDGDLKQLVKYENNVWTVWYNDRYGLVLPENMNDEGDDLAFYMNCNFYSETFNKLKNLSPKGYKYLSPDSIVIEKTMCGDAGDNVKPIMRVRSGSKNYKYTPKMWSTLSEKLQINTINDLLNNKENIVKELLKSRTGKWLNFNNTNEQVLEELNYNLKLVWLNSSQIPDDIQDIMNEEEYKIADIDYIRNNFKIIAGQSNEVQDISSIFESIDDSKDSENSENYLPF